jgi:hypothetical protein
MRLKEDTFHNGARTSDADDEAHPPTRERMTNPMSAEAAFLPTDFP